MMTDVTPAEARAGTAPNSRRQLFAGTFGHLVEWFDWAAYAYLAIFFADAFFPSGAGSGVVPMLGAFGVFAVGFLARPFGGLVLGAFGDRYGRRAALTLSISLMGLGSLVIALTPTYATIGAAAPLLLVFARLLQGVSTGGEWGAASSFIVESAPDGRRGLYSSFLYVGSNIGKIALTLTGAGLIGLLGAGAMEDYGWRILFGIGAALALVGWYIRRASTETSHGVGAAAGPRPRPLDFLRRHPRATLQVFGLSLGPAVAFYTWTAYLPALATTDGGMDRTTSLLVSTATLLLFTVAQPLAGLLSDRVGRRPVLIGSCLVFVLGAAPALGVLDGTVATLLLVQGAGLVALSGVTAISAATMVELFPARLRVSGISFPYALAVAVFGGTAPLVGTALQGAGSVTGYGLYVSATMLLTLVAVLTFPETHRRPLPR